MNAILTILRNDGLYCFTWTQQRVGLLSARAEPICLTMERAISQDQVDALQKQIDAAARALNLSAAHPKSGTASNGLNTGSTFAGLGGALFGLLPEPIRKQIQTLASPSTLQIATTDLNLPWELMHDDDDFLALKHRTARLLMAQKPQYRHQTQPLTEGKVQCLLIADPTGELKEADDEIDAIVRQLQLVRDRVKFDALYSAQRLSTADLRERLANKTYALIHFAGHARPNELLLADGPFRSPDIVDAVRNHPTIILNACASAHAESDGGPGIGNLTSDSESLAGAFIQGGAATVIGMLWVVPDETMKEFGQELYGHLVRGLSVGEALRLSRNALREIDKNGISWLAPILYGDPEEIVIVARAVEATATVLSMRFDVEPVEKQQKVEPTAWAHDYALTQICECIESFGGSIVHATAASLSATFGLDQKQNNDALQALLAARKVRAILDSWHVGGPATAIASGSIATTAADANAAHAQPPRLFGQPLHDCQRLLSTAVAGQIIVDQQTYDFCCEQFSFQPKANTEPDTQESAGYELVSSPVHSDPKGDSNSNTSTTVPDISVGRASELDILKKAWESVCKGQGQIVGIDGEAGVGKTHLVAEFQKSVVPEEVRRLLTACTPDVQQRPYGLLALLFRSLLGLPEFPSEAEVNEALQTRFADFRPLRSGQIDSQLNLVADLLGIVQQNLQIQEKSVYQHQLFELIEHLLGQELETGQLLFILDDAQWADPASMDVLTLIGSDIESVPLLVLVLHRPAWQSPWLGRRYFRSMILDPLGADASGELISALLGTPTLPEDLVPLITRTGGNPLFLREILTSLIERGILLKGDQSTVDANEQPKWHLRGNIEPADLPTSVQRTIEVRLSQLDESQIHLLSLASVIGANFHPKLLLECMKLSNEELLDTLDNLRESDFVRRNFGGSYEFRHALIRDVAYMKIRPLQRRMWHRQVAESLEQEGTLGNDAVAALAEHYYRSLFDDEQENLPQAAHVDDKNIVEKALTYLMQAGQGAVERYGGHEAVTLFQRSSQVAELIEITPERQADIYTGLGDAQQLLSNSDEAMKAYRSAHGVLHTRPLTKETRPQAAYLARKLARLYMWGAQYVDSKRWIEAGFEPVRGHRNKECQMAEALLEIQAGSVCYNQGRYEQTAKHCRRGLEIEAKYSDEEVVGEGNLILGAALYAMGNYATALSHYQMSLEIYHKQKNLYQINRVRMNIGLALFYQGNWSKALLHYKDALAFWEELGEENLQAGMYINIGLAEKYLGNWELAGKYYRQALEIFDKIGNPNWAAQAHSNLGTLHINQRSWQLARKHLTQSLTILSMHSIQDYQAATKSQLALVELSEGKTSKALELATLAVEMTGGNSTQADHAIALRILGQVVAPAGNKEVALEHLKHSQHLLENLENQYQLACTLYQLALVHESIQNNSNAIVLCRKAIAIFRRLEAQKDLDAAIVLYSQLNSQ